MAWTNGERRASERFDLGAGCVYVMENPADQDRVELHEGVGTVVDLSRGGMSLLLGIQPLIEQVIHVHLSHPRTGETLSQIHVLWTRPAEDGESYVAGGKFVSGPFSLSKDRVCAPAEFVSP